MVAEAEKFAADDEAQRKRIEALNSLSSFIYGLKTQLGDQDGLGGKLSEEDKKTILNTIKDTTDWIEENGSDASTEDLEEKLAGAHSFLSRHLQIVTSLQRSRVSSTQSPPSSTPQTHPALRAMMTISCATTMSCRLKKEDEIIIYLPYMMHRIRWWNLFHSGDGSITLANKIPLYFCFGWIFKFVTIHSLGVPCDGIRFV